MLISIGLYFLHNTQKLIGWPSGLELGPCNKSLTFFELVSNPIATSRCRLRFNANLFFFDGIPGLFRVQFPAGTAHFSTPFNTQGTTFSWLLLTYSICPRNMVRRKVAEVSYKLIYVVWYVVKKLSI